MELVDVSTLLTVAAVFNLMAACAWLLLAEVFRMAPKAGRLMAAAHGVRALAMGCPSCWGLLPPMARMGVVETGALASALMLAFALRRLLPSRARAWLLWLPAGIGQLLIVAGVLWGPPRLPAVGAALGVALLMAVAARELVRGAGRLLSAPIVACMALPFVGVAALSGLRTVELLRQPVWDAYFLQSTLPAPARATASLVLTIGITLTLMSLLIWRLIARIQHLTRSDALTGASNRRAFEQHLAEAQALLLRGQGFALVMIDIDHFKRINDQHGHAAGDAALQHCVRIWQAGLREVDRLGRLGGEEFCALLPGTDLAGAALVAERLRAALAAKPLHWRGSPLALTASFGVALPQPGDARGDHGLAEADARLYRAKADGRNRVCATPAAAAT
jgi:diguanylate cyclase (GGDEF)-like protein